jgi:hypothetical protein
MNAKVSLHNVLLIGGIAVLVILGARMASKTKLGSVPVLGQVLNVAGSA